LEDVGDVSQIEGVVEFGGDGKFFFFYYRVYFNRGIHHGFRGFPDDLSELEGSEEAVQNRFKYSGESGMAGFWKTQQIKVPSEAGGKFVATSAGRTAGADKGSILDMFPEMLFAVPDSLFIDHAPENFNSRNGSKHFLSGHISVVNGYDGYGSRSRPKDIFPYFLQFGLD
jgi:hypothetical protein